MTILKNTIAIRNNISSNFEGLFLGYIAPEVIEMAICKPNIQIDNNTWHLSTLKCY